MTSERLEKALKDLPRYGQIVKGYPYRQVWRVEVDGEAFYLKFYPHGPNRWRRLGRGSLAMREFLRLQWLQKAGVPAARAISLLMGLRVNGQKGDAVVIEAIEPAQSLLDIAMRHHLAGTQIPNHRDLLLQVLAILQHMGQAGMGHTDLHLGNFLVKEGKVYLIDAYPLHKHGMLLRDVLRLASSAVGFANLTDFQRGWEQLGPGGMMPLRNGESRPVYRKLMSRIYGDNRYFGTFDLEGWSGTCIKKHVQPRRWSRVSQMVFETADWEQTARALLEQVRNGGMKVLKSSRSGDVLEGEIAVGGRVIEVIVKRPRRRYWYRYLNEIGRGGRARRAWWKSWRLLYRGVACAWPMLLLEKRSLGYVTDALIVFEKVKGPSLASIDLDSLPADARQTLFHRTGALLRKLESAGLYHWDAKSSNWMVQLDDATGPFPLLIDIDGVRNNWGIGEGMRRLLLSMRDHKQYTPPDSLHLCRGYAPYAPVAGKPEV